MKHLLLPDTLDAICLIDQQIADQTDYPLLAQFQVCGNRHPTLQWNLGALAF